MNQHNRQEGAAQERWAIDPQRSRLSFSLRHIVVQHIEGRFERWGGTVFVDRDQPSLSSVEVWIDLPSITTGDEQRDDHVRSPEFLDVEHFPRATFRSQVVQLHGGHVTIDGRLELHGTSRDLRVEVEEEPIGQAADDQPRYTAQATVDRQAFGLHWNQDLDVGGIVLGDQVKIRADLALARVADSAHAAPARS
ncbi:MAG TPA: YceI family protein [Polyangia bacterium]|nr:YceI family protein [Polyangia bacterium]